MKEVLVLLLSGEESESRLLKETLDSSGVRITTMDDVSSALAKMEALGPDLVLIGSGISRPRAQWFLERMMSSSTLRGIPVVLIFYEPNRSWVLDMIKLGLRAFIQLPREKEDFRRRLAQHLPEGVFSARSNPRSPLSRESVGERLRQRIAKKQVESAVVHSGSQSDTDLAKPIVLLEQQFAEESGLMVRTSSREISLFEKIDDYLLRFGGSNSHVVGIFMGLLVDGKIRVALRDKSERLSLASLSDKKTPEAAIRIIDSYLRQSESSQLLDTRTQKIIL
jgi:response regulator RpfG family c-di-GMP phosphodiesterase